VAVVVTARLPGPEPEPTFHHLAIHPEFARNSLGAFASLRARHHLSHQISA
jgi:hypothetical protein